MNRVNSQTVLKRFWVMQVPGHPKLVRLYRKKPPLDYGAPCAWQFCADDFGAITGWTLIDWQPVAVQLGHAPLGRVRKKSSRKKTLRKTR